MGNMLSEFGLTLPAQNNTKGTSSHVMDGVYVEIFFSSVM